MGIRVTVTYQIQPQESTESTWPSFPHLHNAILINPVSTFSLTMICKLCVGLWKPSKDLGLVPTRLNRKYFIILIHMLRRGEVKKLILVEHFLFTQQIQLFSYIILFKAYYDCSCCWASINKFSKTLWGR